MTLKDICKKKGITQKELGAATGITQSAISMYISGRKRPTYNTARKMANVLGITVEDLFACLPNVDGKIEEPQKALPLDADEQEELSFQERIVVSCMRKLSSKGQDVLVQTALNIVRRDEEEEMQRK